MHARPARLSLAHASGSAPPAQTCASGSVLGSKQPRGAIELLVRLSDMPGAQQVLRSVYRAFNARDAESALELMHPDVDWPNAWEGGRVVGRAAVGEYWRRQFSAISSTVDPESFTDEPDGSVTVDVHAVVRDASTAKLLSDSRIRHRYRLRDGLIVRMDVLEPNDRP